MKNTPVAVVSKISTMKALMVSQQMPIVEAVERFSSNEGQHGIFLVDDRNRLTGVVNNSDLLDWARVQFNLSPGSLPPGAVASSTLPSPRLEASVSAPMLEPVSGPLPAATVKSVGSMRQLP